MQMFGRCRCVQDVWSLECSVIHETRSNVCIDLSQAGLVDRDEVGCHSIDIHSASYFSPSRLISFYIFPLYLLLLIIDLYVRK